MALQPRKPRQSRKLALRHELTDVAIHTSQEIDVLERSACDGYTGDNWKNIEEMDKRVYELDGGSHYVSLSLSSEDSLDGLTLAALERLTLAQDADFAFAMLCICSMIAPPNPLPHNRAAVEWIDLDHIMEKIGWYPSKRSTSERSALRARLWNYIVYGHRAAVHGDRTWTYTDRNTGEEIETRTESPIWRVMSKERPVQAELFDDVPRRVQVVISKQWEPLLTLPSLAQYLPLGELLGAIPPEKVTGDWARVVGLAIANLWRRNPSEALKGTIRPTRHELLTRYTPKSRTVDDFLSADNKNPKFEVRYWREALSVLVNAGLLSKQGEPSRSVKQMLDAHGRQGWREKWLEERVELWPGEKWQEPIQERAVPRPPSKREMLAAVRKKRGK